MAEGNTSCPSIKFMKCLQFAAMKHKDQRRKDPKQTPYINHPINVATILTVEGRVTNEDVILAGLLHDTVEDTDTTFNEIEENFGSRICSIVKEVTDDKRLPAQERKRLQIMHAKESSHEAKLVKLADKLDNLRDLKRVMPVDWTKKRRDQYFCWAKQVVDNLRGTNQTLEELLDCIFVEENLM